MGLRATAKKTILTTFLIGAASFAALCGSETDALAVGTRTFDLSTSDDLSSGDLTGVAVDSRGQVRPGFALGKTPVNDAQSAWGSVLMPDGAILIGTGNEGKIIRVNGGTVEVAATTGQMAISALAIAWGGDVIAGSFPNGKLYRLPKGQGKDVAAKEFGTKVEGVEYIWSLAYDEKSKSLYAATGPEGKVIRIDDQGKAQVHFDAEDPHVVSLALTADGKVYAGTAGKSLLYRIDAPGRATVVHDFDAEDVSNISIAKDGTVWATANKYGGSFSYPGKSGGGSIATPQSARPSKAGEGVLYRFLNGVAEQMIDSKKTHFTALALTDDGVPYVGAGAEGRVMTVNADHLERIVADVEERQISTIVMSGKKRFLVASDPVVVHEIKGEGGQDAVWTSKVLDAGLPAEFGNLSWRSTGSVEVETRSGNTQDPDTTWSAWSKPLTQPGKPASPKGRYVQIRARFKDAAASFGEVRFHFVTDNVRAVITSVSAEGRSQRSGRLQTGLQSSGGKISKSSTSVSIKWDIDNPDKDELRYRIFYKLEGQTQWREALKPTDIHTKSDLDWDTTSLPEGLYRIRVESTDELVNPPDKVTRHSLESGLVLVDNTPPLFKSLAIAGRKLSAEVTDGLGPIARVEISLAGSDDWRPLFPSDGIYDEATEKIEADVSALVPPGSRLIGIRAYDTAGNSVSKELEAK